MKIKLRSKHNWAKSAEFTQNNLILDYNCVWHKPLGKHVYFKLYWFNESVDRYWNEKRWRRVVWDNLTLRCKLLMFTRWPCTKIENIKQNITLANFLCWITPVFYYGSLFEKSWILRTLISLIRSETLKNATKNSTQTCVVSPLFNLW